MKKLRLCKFYTKSTFVELPIFILILLFSNIIKAQPYTVSWRSEASNYYWANSDESSIDNWWRQEDNYLIRRPDLTWNEWSVNGTKTHNVIKFENGVEPTTYVNGNLGGTQYYVHKLLFNNSTNRVFHSSDNGYWSMGGGSSNAAIETGSSGTGEYSINVPIVYEKAVDIKSIYGKIIINSDINNGGFNTYVYSGGNSNTIFIHSGNLSGTGGFQLNDGAAFLTQTTKTYSGNTVINTGNNYSTWLGLSCDLPNSDITINAWGALQAEGGGTVTVKSVTIADNGYLYVDDNTTLVVTGSFSCANNGHVIVKPTGNLIISSSGVQGSFQLSVQGNWSTPESGWHFISSPVSGQAISAMAPTSGGWDFYGWDEPSDLWINFQSSGFSTWNGGTDFVVGRGYLISYQNNQTLTFTGTINVNDVTWEDLSYTPSSSHTGWHLLGNPFSSAINWDPLPANSTSWQTQNVAGTAKVWMESSKSYTDIYDGDNIAKMQGFMVNVESGVNKIVIPASSRVSTDVTWLKDSESLALQILAKPFDNSSSQEFNVRLVSDATEGFDFYYDSRFLEGYAPPFYAMIDNEKLSTCALPNIDDNTLIPLGFKKLTSQSDYIIELTKCNIVGNVYLEDIKTGKIHNLTQNPLYNFSSSSNDPENRFILRFSDVSTGLKDDSKKPKQLIYLVNDMLYMRHFDTPKTIEVYTISGKLVLQDQTLSDHFFLNLAKGVYVVRVFDGKHSKVEKIVFGQ